VVVLFILAGVTSTVEAESLPWNIGVDSSFRIEYLFGRQILRQLDPIFTGVDRFVNDYDPRVPVLAGTIEITPLPVISGRLTGSISVLERSGAQVRSATGPLFPGGEWDVKLNFSSWEAAGLFHLWSGGGYRYSLTAGYRQQTWDYQGVPSNGVPNSPLHNSFSSRIPFIGMQTSMFFPSWKARFEVLGSPFMNLAVSNALQLGGFARQLDGNLYRGGLVELEMAGDVNLAANVFVGLYGRYSYQELYGSLSGIGPETGIVPNPYSVFMGQSVGTVGLDVTVVF